VLLNRRVSDMRQNPVGEPAATAALNFGTPRRRSSLKRLCPFWPLPPKIRALSFGGSTLSRFVSTRGVCRNRSSRAIP